MSIAEVGSDGERDEETQAEKKTSRRMGHGYPETHTNERGEIGPRLPAFQQSRAWVFIVRVRVRSDTMYATQMGRRESQS